MSNKSAAKTRKSIERTPSYTHEPRSRSKKRNPSSPIDDQEVKKLYLSSSSPDISVPQASQRTPSASLISNVETSHHDDISQSHFSFKQDDLKFIAECLKDSFKSEMKELIKESMKEIIDQSLSKMNDRIHELEGKVLYLENENETLSDTVNKLEMKCDENEQYSRRYSIRVAGIPEKPDEKIDQIVTDMCNKLSNNVSIADIDRCHRVGRKDFQNNKPRAIIVKFASYNARRSFYQSRLGLKNSGFDHVFFNEDLTKRRNALLYKARQLSKQNRVKKAWSSDGQVLVKDLNDKIVPIYGEHSIRDFM